MYTKKKYNTAARYHNLLEDIKATYNTSIVTFRQISDVIKKSPEKYPHVNSILTKEEYRQSYGKYDLSFIESDYVKISDHEHKINNDPIALYNYLFG